MPGPVMRKVEGSVKEAKTCDRIAEAKDGSPSWNSALRADDTLSP